MGSAEPSRSPQPPLRQLRPSDLSRSFDLLNQAINSVGALKPKAGHVLVETQLMEELRNRLHAYEAERLRLRFDLDFARHCAETYLKRCKTAEAELNQHKNAYQPDM